MMTMTYEFIRTDEKGQVWNFENGEGKNVLINACSAEEAEEKLLEMVDEAYIEEAEQCNARKIDIEWIDDEHYEIWE